MANKDITKKEGENTGIENLDASLSTFGSKVEKHKKAILWGVGGILIVALGCFGWYFYRKHANAKSSEEFSKAYITSIQAAAKADSSNPDSLFNATLIKEMTKVANAEEGKNGANLANLQLAATYYSTGKAKEALAALEKVDIDEPIMEMNSMILKGDCYVDLNKLGDATTAYTEAFDKAQKEDNPEIAVRALCKKAQVLHEQKKYADALAIYEQILADYPQTANSLNSSQMTQMGATPTMNIEAYAERERALAGK